MLYYVHANGWAIQRTLVLSKFLQFLPNPSFISLIAPCSTNTVEDTSNCQVDYD